MDSINNRCKLQGDSFFGGSLGDGAECSSAKVSVKAGSLAGGVSIESQFREIFGSKYQVAQPQLEGAANWKAEIVNVLKDVLRSLPGLGRFIEHPLPGHGRGDGGWGHGRGHGPGFGRGCGDRIRYPEFPGHRILPFPGPGAGCVDPGFQLPQPPRDPVRPGLPTPPDGPGYYRPMPMPPLPRPLPGCPGDRPPVQQPPVCNPPAPTPLPGVGKPVDPAQDLLLTQRGTRAQSQEDLGRILVEHQLDQLGPEVRKAYAESYASELQKLKDEGAESNVIENATKRALKQLVGKGLLTQGAAEEIKSVAFTVAASVPDNCKGVIPGKLSDDLSENYSGDLGSGKSVPSLLREVLGNRAGRVSGSLEDTYYTVKAPQIPDSPPGGTGSNGDTVIPPGGSTDNGNSVGGGSVGGSGGSNDTPGAGNIGNTGGAGGTGTVGGAGESKPKPVLPTLGDSAKILFPEADQLNEEQLAAVVVHQQLSLSDPAQATIFRNSFIHHRRELVGKDDRVESSIKLALQKLVNDKKLTKERAEEIFGTAFAAAQLDNNNNDLAGGPKGDENSCPRVKKGKSLELADSVLERISAGTRQKPKSRSIKV